MFSGEKSGETMGTSEEVSGNVNTRAGTAMQQEQQKGQSKGTGTRHTGTRYVSWGKTKPMVQCTCEVLAIAPGQMSTQSISVGHHHCKRGSCRD